jgi:hypothetical protein
MSLLSGSADVRASYHSDLLHPTSGFLLGLLFRCSL